MEMIAAEGGAYAGETGTDVRLEICSAQAGIRATERNLVPRGKPRAETGESEYYIFRMIGPFRR